MRHATISGHDDSHDVVALTLWIFAGLIAIIALGDAVALLAVVLVLVMMGGWIYHRVERRVASSQAPIAAVTHLRPALTGQRGLKAAPVHESWRGPSAA